MPADIILKELFKQFKKSEKKIGFITLKEKIVTAVNKVSFSVNEGEIFGILGPNGAGKTTLIKILSTLIIPDSGTAYVNGYEILTEDQKVRASIGVVTGGERSIYWKLTPKENLLFFAKLYGVPSDIAKKRAQELLSIMELEEQENVAVEDLSSGMKMKVILARSLIHDPPILFFDEPTIGLDPSFSREIRKFIRNVLNKKEGKTILLTTHYMEEADYLCNRIALMSKGKIVRIDSPRVLKESIKKHDIIMLELSPNYVKEIEHILNKIAIYDSYQISNSDKNATIKILTKQGLDLIDYLITEAKKRKISFFNFKMQEPTLDDVFIHYTGKRLEEEEDED